MEDSLLEEVEGEVEIMRSAYSEEFTDLREQDVWKVRRPPDVRLKLGPHHSQGGTLHTHVYVELRIKTTEKYPNEAAEIFLESSSGLSHKEVNQLDSQLRETAWSFAQDGMVVMLELCQNTQRYLSEHARPYSDSIYDEMIATHEARRQANEEAKEKSRRRRELLEEEQRTVNREEVARVKEELKEEERQKREQRTRLSFKDFCYSEKPQGSESSESPSHLRMKSRSLSECSSESGSGDPCMVMRFPLGGKQERIVSITGSLAERRNQGCCIFEAFEKSTGERGVVYHWEMKLKRIGRKGSHTKIGQDSQLEELIGKFGVLEKEMTSILKLSHANLVHYWAMKVSPRLNDGLDVCILQEYVQGTSMKFYIECQLPVSVHILKHIAKGTLEALNYLHTSNIVHRDLRDSSIYFDNQTRLVRVADYGVERRIVEAVMEFNESSRLPSSYPQSPGRGGKKGDIYRLGLVILSLFLGQRVQEIIPTLPSELSTEVKDFLQKCLEVSDQDRWTVERLLNHQFINKVCDRNEVQKNDKSREATQNKYDSQEEDMSSGEGAELSSEMPPDLPPNLQGFSRLRQEYHILAWLGKGGFGHVFKVRNKVDDREYAVKRIPLHQQSTGVKKKIIREVKLLSSLNHENVVRYYTSWIEDLIQVKDDENSTVDGSMSEGKDTSPTDTDNTTNSQCTPSTDKPSSDSLSKSELKDKDEDSEWSILFEGSANHQSFSTATVDDEESDEDDDEWLISSLAPMMKDEDESSDGIEFYDSQNPEIETDYMDQTDSKALTSVPHKKFQFLYIQMQLCEKNTLRHAINKGLYVDEDRMWRLFREMVNGLDYIHSQGLIHRDLKPGNIFLDSLDHVKIGDFGLATAAIKAKTTIGIISKLDLEENSQSTLTSQVGTTFYIAPEVTKAKGKVSYTSKVDIYSLGVIFFEMVYPPLKTGMERAKILSALRMREICFPDDLVERENFPCRKLIRLLLNEDPHSRPTTTEILKSSLLPPPTAEERKFMETLETKLENTRLASYQEVLNLVFKPSARPELHATFEVNHQLSSDYCTYWKQDYLHSLINAIFKAHGGIWVPTPFYIPKGSFYGHKENLVSLMSRRGELISAQFELRYPFARFVARNEIKYMRRYCIDRVQRAYKVSGIHPKESYECAFDIISSKRESLESAARVMLVAHDLIQQIMQGRANEISINLGHMELVQVILKHCGIEESLHNKVIMLLKEWNGKRITFENLGECLRDLGVARPSAETLKGFLCLDGPVEEVLKTLRSRGITSRHRNLTAVAKQVMNEIEEVAETAFVLGVKYNMNFKPMMVADVHLYCGLMCQFLMDVKKKNTIAQELLAQGGSYEHLIQKHRNTSTFVPKTSNYEIPSAFGISLFLDKFLCCVSNISELIASGKSDIAKITAGYGCGVGVVSVLVAAVGPKQLQSRVDIVSKLRASNVAADHCHCLTTEETEAIVEELSIPNLVILTGGDKATVKATSDPSGAGARMERKLPLEKVYELLIKTLGISESTTLTGYSRSDSKTTSVNNQEDIQLNIQYITNSSKKQPKSRDTPKVEQTTIYKDVMHAVTSRWPSLGPSTTLEIWAVEVDRKVLLAFGLLDTDSFAKNFKDTVHDLKTMFADQKDYIEEICNLLHRKIFPRKKSERCLPIILYSTLSPGVFKRIV